jgi:hypothetical protein
MAKIENTKTRGSNKQPKGTMPADMLVRYKLKENLKDSTRFVSRNSSVVKKFSRMISTYRVYVHGAQSTKLPACLRSTAHYFSVPLTRADSDNARDRRGLETEVVTTETV